MGFSLRASFYLSDSTTGLGLTGKSSSTYYTSIFLCEDGVTSGLGDIHGTATIVEDGAGNYGITVTTASTPVKEVKLIVTPSTSTWVATPVIIGADSLGVLAGTKRAVTLAYGDVTGNLPANVIQVAGQTASASGAVTFPSSIGTSTLTQSQVTGGAYALATDGSGYLKLSAGTGTGQISLSSGLVTVGTNNDKSGYSISGTKTTLDALNDVSSSGVTSATNTALTNYGSGGVAQENTVLGIQSTSRLSTAIPSELVVPSSGYTVYELHTLFYDALGNLLDPDSNELAIRILDVSGNPKTAMFDDAAVTIPATASITFPSYYKLYRVSTGHYHTFYKILSTEPEPNQWTFEYELYASAVLYQYLRTAGVTSTTSGVVTLDSSSTNKTIIAQSLKDQDVSATSAVTGSVYKGLDTDINAVPSGILSTAVPGAFVSGTVGYLVGTNLNATVGSRSTFNYSSNQVTVATNNDKTGYALTSGERTSIASDVWSYDVLSSNAYSGTCTTNGTAVVRYSGSAFTNFSTTIVINGTVYTISSVTDANNMILNSSAGIQSSPVFYFSGSFSALLNAALANGQVRLSYDGMDSVVVETGLNARQAMSIVGSALAGQLSGGGSNNLVFRAVGDPSSQRILAQVDSSSNRLSVSVYPPS